MQMRLIAAAVALVASGLGAARGEDLKLAIVAPVADSAFFGAVNAGCVARATTLARDGDTLGCLFAGPGFVLPQPDAAAPAAAADATAPAAPPRDPRTQAAIVRDFIAAHVDGIALSPMDDPTVVAAIDAAVHAGIPVLTFDADAPTSSRTAFVGTNARDFGRALGASLKRWKPKGGKFAILSTDPKQPNIAERIIGIRDAIGPGWKEIADSPVITSGDFSDAVARVDKLLGQYFDVDAIISVGAWPMLATDEWRTMIDKYKPRIDKADVVLVVADALPAQRNLVREGLGHVLVGQRPADMGARIAEMIMDLKHGRKVPEVVYTGFDTLTRLDLAAPAK